MKSRKYRDIIDKLVQVCKNGQGQIGPHRVRNGIWNPNAREDFIPEQHKRNVLLAGLSQDQREVVAEMLEEQFSGGMFEVLKALEEFKIKPFTEGYEGSPYHDFIGRLDGWEWPEDVE
jgi:hypothetical protein